MENITDMAVRMKADVDSNVYKGKIYKTDTSGGTEVQRFNRQTIQNSVGAIANSIRNDTRDKVDLFDIEDVKQRTYNYVVACQQAGLLPGMSGLAG